MVINGKKIVDPAESSVARNLRRVLAEMLVCGDHRNAKFSGLREQMLERIPGRNEVLNLIGIQSKQRPLPRRAKMASWNRARISDAKDSSLSLPKSGLLKAKYHPRAVIEGIRNVESNLLSYDVPNGRIG